MKKKSRYPHNHWFSTVLALSVLGTQCLFASQAENNFWSERRKSTRRTSSTLLASLPLGGGSVPANVLTGESRLTAQFPTLERVGSSLPVSVARGIPAYFSKRHAKLFAALSPAHGTIRKVSFPKSPAASGPVVIHIQDVHMNQEAQWNIRETVKSLLLSGRVGLMALEGSTEPIDLQVFVDYPHAKAVEMAADYLLKENKISGPIHAALTARGKLPWILGVDDSSHYAANVQAYRDSAPKLEKTRQEIMAIQKEIEAQKEVIFSPALQSFDQQVQHYREGKSSLGDYVRLLTNQIDPDRKGQGVGDFLAALHMERTLDFKQVESERTQLIERLTPTLTTEETKRLAAQSLDYRAGHLGYGDFYSNLSALCEKKGVQLKSFPALNSYVKYVFLADGIDAEQLMAEISALEKTAYARQIKTSEEKSLAVRSRQAWLTGKLVDFALTPREWKEYDAGPRPLAQEALGPFEKFYEEAHARDMAMSKNLLQAMKDGSFLTKADEDPLTLLVTGGFHAEGMTQQLIQQGVVVISYVPKIEKVDTVQGSTYLSVFTQEKSPLEKLFAGEKLFLARIPISRVDRQIQTPLLVAAATLFLGLLTASADFSAAYELAGGIGNLRSLELSTIAVEGIISISAVVVGFKISTGGSPRGSFPVIISMETGPVKNKGTHFWQVLRDAMTEEFFGNLKKINLTGFLKGRMPMILLGAGGGVSGPLSMMFGGLFLLWVIKGIPYQYRFVLDHENKILQQIYVRSVGTIFLNVIAFSVPFFGDFTLLSNALLVGTTGVIGAHTLWNILAEWGRKIHLWEQDYRLVIDLKGHVFSNNLQVIWQSDVFGTLNEERIKTLMETYSVRMKKIAPTIYFIKGKESCIELSRDRTALYFIVPPEIESNDEHVKNYIDEFLDEMEKYLIQPHAGFIYLLPVSSEMGEFLDIKGRLETIFATHTLGGQKLRVILERDTYFNLSYAKFLNERAPSDFQRIVFSIDGDAVWEKFFKIIETFISHEPESFVSEGSLSDLLVRWAVDKDVFFSYERVSSESQKLFLQGSWWRIDPSVFPLPGEKAFNSRDIKLLEEKIFHWAFASAKNRFLRVKEMGELLMGRFPISPRLGYVVIYGPEHLPHLPPVPGLTVVPAPRWEEYLTQKNQSTGHFRAQEPNFFVPDPADGRTVPTGESRLNLPVIPADSTTLLEQLIQEIEGFYGPQGFSSDIKKSKKSTVLIQQALLFSLFVRWAQRSLSEDDKIRLSRLVEEMTRSMTIGAIREWTLDLLNKRESQWDLLWNTASNRSPQDLNFLKTILHGRFQERGPFLITIPQKGEDEKTIELIDFNCIGNQEKIDSVRVIVTRSNGKILVLENLTGGLEFPGGGVNTGEALSAAAVRGLAEETKLQAYGIDFLSDGVHFAYQYQHGEKPPVVQLVHVAVTQVDSTTNVSLSGEHSKALWVNPEELDQRMTSLTLATRLALFMFRWNAKEGWRKIFSLKPIDEGKEGNPSLLIETGGTDYLLENGEMYPERPFFGASEIKSTSATLSWFWRLFSEYGPLDQILRLAKWESASLSIGMGAAVGAHILLGASLGWAFGMAILLGFWGAPIGLGPMGWSGGNFRKWWGKILWGRRCLGFCGRRHLVCLFICWGVYCLKIEWFLACSWPRGSGHPLG